MEPIGSDACAFTEEAVDDFGQGHQPVEYEYPIKIRLMLA